MGGDSTQRASSIPAWFYFFKKRLIWNKKKNKMIFKILKNISGNNQAKGEKDEGVRDESKTMRRALF